MTSFDAVAGFPTVKTPLFERLKLFIRRTFSAKIWLLTVLVLVMGVAGSIAVYQAVYANHIGIIRARLQNQAERATHELGDRLNVRARAAAHYADVWRMYESMTDERWDILAKNFRIENEGMQMAIWVDSTYTIKKLVSADAAFKSSVDSLEAHYPHIFQFLKNIPETSTNVAISPIIDRGHEMRLFLVAPLQRKNGAFDGFLIFMHRADLILADTAKIIDPRMGLDVSDTKRSFYQTVAEQPYRRSPLAVTLPVPFSGGVLSLTVFPLNEMKAGRSLLANMLMTSGLVLTALILVMIWQVSHLARARREVIGSRQQIQASEQRYRSLITGCDLGWVVLDENLCVIDANAPYVRMAGFESYAEIAGRSVLEWVDAKSQAAVARARSNVAVTQDNVDYRWPDGTVRHLIADMAVREGRNGREVVALCRDVTERMTALRDVELRDRAMQAAGSAILICAMEHHGHKVIYCNRAFEAMTGFSRDEIVGKSPTYFSPDQSNDAEWQRIQANLNAGQGAQGYLATTRKDGTRIIRQVYTTPVLGADGKPTHVISISTDVTEEQRKAEHLRLRERAIESSQNGILIVDARQAGLPITFCNSAVLRLTGYTADEIVGQNCSFLQGGDLDQPEIQVIRRALSDAKSTSVVLRNYKKDGEMFWNEMHIDPVVDETGTLTHFIGVINDVTARKEAEAQLLQVQKMDAIGQLTGGVAHDFNNLLTVIIGNSKLIQDTLPEDEKQMRRVGLVLRAAERGAELTQRLLAFSRKQTLRTQILDLNTMVQDMQHLVQRTIGENIASQFILTDQVCAVCVDRGQLENALLNLVINARDAMAHSGNLIVTTKHTSIGPGLATQMGVPPGPYVELAVSDTGIGMTPDVRQRAFEPFFTTKDVGKGTGLGLSMVFGFVKQSGGHVSIYSELGHGTTVKLYLPYSAAIEAETAPQPVADANEPAYIHKVLVVEDDDFVRATTTTILENKGFTVVEAACGEAALEILAAHPDISLVFSDIIMPGRLNGIELFRLIRSRYPHVRVALTSGYPREVLKLDLNDPEGPLLINKPYDPKALAKNLALYAANGTVRRA